jgi:microcystin degradation protein MlrC
MRIFVAGFQHETNTFAPTRAGWPAFASGSAFPAFSHGEAMLDRLGPTSLPMGGFIRSARQRGWTLLPSAWAGASPSAHVTRDAFERIAEHIVGDARRGGFDAVYLDLHGAAVAEHVDDAEGELLERLRQVIGPLMPLVASLDLHANVTRRMLQHASAMSAYRTYPHVDGADTGARCAELLAELWAHGKAWATHPVRLPFLLPLNAQSTMMEPARGVYERLAERDVRSGVRLSFAMGFPAADFDECGPVVFGHGPDAQAVQRAVMDVAHEVIELRPDWALELFSPAEAVQRALALAARSDKPVVIADTQDNPGAGADSNTTGMLHALLAAGAGRRFAGEVALGLLYDPAAARTAHAAGVGATLEMSLGTAVRCFDGSLSDPPLRARFKVLSLSDGVVPMHGPMTAGGTAHLGPSACLETDGIRINVVSGQCQMLDLDLYRFLGVQPEAMKLLVNKSSVHFRAAFTPIAAHILVAVAPGPMAADPAALPWTRLPAGIARRP